MQKLGNYVLIHKKVNRDAGLMGDSVYRFYSPKALRNWSQADMLRCILLTSRNASADNVCTDETKILISLLAV